MMASILQKKVEAAIQCDTSIVRPVLQDRKLTLWRDQGKYDIFARMLKSIKPETQPAKHNAHHHGIFNQKNKTDIVN